MALFTDPLVRGSILGKSLRGVGSELGLVGMSSTPMACKSKTISVGCQSCCRSNAASMSNNAVRSKIFSLAKLGDRCTKFLYSKNSRTSLKGMAERNNVVGEVKDWEKWMIEMTHMCVQHHVSKSHW